MKCQLIGFHHSAGVDKDTGVPYKTCNLFFVRNPTLSEDGVQGNVCFSTKVRNDNIDKLPELIVNNAYLVDCHSYQGRYFLDDMTSIK